MKANTDKKPSKKLWIVGILLLLGAVIFFIPKGASNLAQLTAEPLEEMLIKAGATKICSDGNAGHGFGNDQPWYASYFESSMDLATAKSSIVASVNNNGFSLNEMPRGTDGYLGDVVYKDTATKNSPYSELRNGKVSTTVAFTNSPLSACSPSIKADASHTAITLEIRLPEFKK